ncbi:MAG: ATP-dependent endonuclease [Phycisphaerales bacterium]
MLGERLHGFGIANYRSFDSTGVYIPDIRKFNVLIGKNNAGKSNVLHLLHGCAQSAQKGVTDKVYGTMNMHHGVGEHPDVLFHISIDDYNGPVNNNITEVINSLYHRNILCTLKPQHPHQFRMLTSFQTVHDSSLNNRILCKLFGCTPPDGHLNRRDAIQAISEAIKKRAIEGLHEIVSKLVYIPDVRHIHDGPDNHVGVIVVQNGRNVIGRLHEMQNPPAGQESSRDQFREIESIARNLLGERKLTLEVQYDRKELLLTMHGQRLPIRYFGSAVHQLIIICATLVLNPSSVVCIEEPETFMHPELLRRFIAFLKTTNNPHYFITTHSSVLLDMLDLGADMGVSHITHDGTKSSLKWIDGSKAKRKVLDDLGCRASDILQSNGIIWVEGPSDRTFIRKWISLVDSRLQEGLHYSILTYGGSNLAHLSADTTERDEADLIDLLKINRNAVVVMDSDSTVNGNPLAERKQQIVNVIGEEGVWITEGREIENYISRELLIKYLDKYGMSKGTHVQFGKKGKIETVIKMALGTKTTHPKVRRAIEICELMHDGDLDHLDLRERVTRLVEKICVWNSLTGSQEKQNAT